MEETTEPTSATEDAPTVIGHRVNSTDATVGQPIVARVTARKTELEAILSSLPADDTRTQNDISTALATVNELLSGDLEHVPGVVTADMNRWLERNKHLAERADTAGIVAPPAPANGTSTDVPQETPQETT